ncbi:hypothetical protein ACMFMG_005366 [Clarireedia jacksonii]
MEDNPSESSRKRPRPVVSCLRCREKKLKCDRTLPCHNCAKSSHSSACTYSDEVNPGSASKRQVTVPVGTQSEKGRGLSRDVEAAPTTGGTVKPVSSNGVGVVEDLQLRVANLEKLLHVSIESSGLNVPKQKNGSDSAAVDLVDDFRQTPSTAPEPYTLVVKGPRSRYHGPNDRITLLHQFKETMDFINNIPKDNAPIIHLAKDIEYLQKKSKKGSKVRRESTFQRNAQPLEILRESFPEKQMCDRLIKIYVDHFENTLRVLHVPSFLQQYEAFWTSNDRNSEPIAFLPQLMTILVIGYTLDGSSDLNAEQNNISYLDNSALDHVEGWISQLDRKHKIDFSTLQTETLLILARQIRGFPADELWCAIGSMVRSATVMGLHLNPKKLKKISTFQAELRKRLWVTILQMDLHASIAANMATANIALDLDGMIPTNINDEEFNESTKTLPPSKPLSEWTDALPQVILATALTQQLKIMRLMGSTTVGINLPQAVKEGRILEDLLANLPSTFKLDSTSHHGIDLLKRVLVNIYLQRPLLHIYSMLIRQDWEIDAIFSELQRFCLKSSVGVLNHRDHFDPMVTDPNNTYSKSSWKLFNIYFKNDVIRASFMICQYIQFLTTKSHMLDRDHEFTHTSGTDALARDPQFSKAKLIRLLENTLNSLIESSADSGIDIKDIMFISVTIQSVRSSCTGELKGKLMRDGGIKALLAYKEILLHSCLDDDIQLPSQTPISTMVEEHQNHTRNMYNIAAKGDEARHITQPDHMQEPIPPAMSLDQENMFDFSDIGIFDMDYDWGNFDIGQ